jgi:hemerythrin-like domain-containing protein
MDALTLLKQQHEEVAALFAQLEESDDPDVKRACFEEIADDLVIHTIIEERIFYPAVHARQTEQELVETLNEHLEIKKLLVDAMESIGEPAWGTKVAALQGAVENHVEEEENHLFPLARKLFGADVLEAIGQRLDTDTEMLKAQGVPRAKAKLDLESPASHI